MRDNIPEAVFAGKVFSLPIPEILYTHYHDAVMLEKGGKLVKTDNYFPGSFDLYAGAHLVPNLIIGTQTEFNLEMLKKQNVNAIWLPMQVPDPLLLNTERNPDSWGVGWIGPRDQRKDPKRFIELIKNTGLPAKILTKPKSAKAFEKELKDAGVEFEIKCDLTTEQKVEFIKSMRVGFFPSIREGFGLGVFECAHVIPTFVIQEYDWIRNLEGFVIPVKNKDAESVILSAYEHLKPNGSQYKAPFLDYHDKAREQWLKVFSDLEQVPKKKRVNHISAIVDKAKTISVNRILTDHVASVPAISHTSSNYILLGCSTL